MNLYGDNSGDQLNKGRPAIARRSCDQCRARKVGCDRASPCSNCMTARLSCTHSAVASSGTPAKQRVLVTAKYEQRLDDIANDINGIKYLLERLNIAQDATQSESALNKSPAKTNLAKHPVANQAVSISGDQTCPWHHSAHIIDLVRHVVEDNGLRGVGPEENKVISSLKNLMQALERPAPTQDLSSSKAKLVKDYDNPPMPPLDAAVTILRWAKDHESISRMVWISQILPLETFANICRNVYFSVDGYSQIDLIIANGYLSYIFSEHVATSGLEEYQEYSRLSRANLQDALSRLPLLLPASMEAIAALALGTLNAIENSNTTSAWTFVSAAASMCQTMKYHCSRSSTEDGSDSQTAQRRLFWAIYRFDKSLSLRLGRSSTIRDSDITLPLSPVEPRPSTLARIQGKTYEELYSPVGLSRQGDDRGYCAAALAVQVRKLIDETYFDLSEANSQSSELKTDQMQVIYLQFDLVCQSSLLAQILRAVPNTNGYVHGASDECVAVARETLDLHEQCMNAIYGHNSNPFMATKYISWAILHIPFVPFSILFTRAVQLWDLDDLVRLERFTVSLKPEKTSSDSITHPYLLYNLLCQTARLYFERNTFSAPENPTLAEDPLVGFNFDHVDTIPGLAVLGGDSSQLFQLSDWYYDNQQMMNLLDENAMF